MDRKLSLRTEGAEFAGIVIDRKGRQLIFKWFARTEIKNITYMSLLVFRLGWPPVRRVKGFVGNDN